MALTIEPGAASMSFDIVNGAGYTLATVWSGNAQPSEKRARSNAQAMANAWAMIAILESVQGVINMSDPEHEDFADSAADCLQALLEACDGPVAAILARIKAPT